MGNARSDSPPVAVHPVLAVVAVAGGTLAMMIATVVVAGTAGLRSALVAGETCLTIPGLLFLALSGVPIVAGLALRPVRARTALFAMAAGAALWAASLGLMNVQFVVWRPPAEFLDTFRRLHQALRPSNPAEAALSVIAIALMPALCEETLFRGVVLGSLLRFGTTTALLASSGLFALIHIDVVAAIPTFHRVPFAFAVGLGLGSLRLRTGSLIPSILAHAVINTITFATVFLTGAAAEAIDEPQVVMGASLLVAGTAASALLMRTLRGR